jgi:hypothetical protein
MTRITVGKWDFRYIVGLNTVGIITQSRKKHIARITVVREGSNRDLTQNRELVSPEEVADYIIRARLS